jgi:hypothetical protein
VRDDSQREPVGQFEDPFHRAIDVLAVGDVAAQRVDARMPGGERGEAGLVEIERGHPETTGGEGGGGVPADAAGRAGDQREARRRGFGGCRGLDGYR